MTIAHHLFIDPVRRPRTVATLLVAGLLAGCSPSEKAAETILAPAAAPAETGATVGGDGSDIQLDTLTEDDLKNGGLTGELACSFSTDGTAPILFASGDVGSDDPARGLVKVSGYVEQIGAPGGFNGITNGATFSGKGKTIKLAVTGPATGGGESPARPGSLTYQRADGASRTFEGQWQCGP